jgi:hypothetical protein
MPIEDGGALPRLLYIGEVPVESTVHGSALLYRLLVGWPADRLRIVESTYFSSPKTRIANVDYRFMPIRFIRILSTRFSRRYRKCLFKSALRAGKRAIRVAQAEQFRPDAILTVAHGVAWLAAANAAKRLGIPLHLIIHDDPFKMSYLLPDMKQEFEEMLGSVYRQAASRLCVSPYMAKIYEKQFGVPGDVLYPGRSPDAPVFEIPPDRLTQSDRPLTYVYAGTINMRGYVESLLKLSQALKARGHRLKIFSNLEPGSATAAELSAPHVDLKPIIPFKELIDILRSSADVLYVPMSFEAVDRQHMELSFPSKFTDYTIVGLPLLVSGPSYCAAIRWVTENPGAAVTVGDQSLQSLDAALVELDIPSRRLELARNALRLGNQFFSHSASFRTFTSILSGASLKTR